MFACASGQWKIKFNQKEKKGFFSKFNGDMVKVPLLYHQKYMATMNYDTQLKAQVRNMLYSNQCLNPTQTFLPVNGIRNDSLYKYYSKYKCYFSLILSHSA